MEKYVCKVSERVWGKIHDCKAFFPDIYFVSGKRQEGYVIPKNYAGTLLTPKALSFGTEHDGFLFFAAGDTMNIIEYELLEYRLNSSPDIAEKNKMQKLMDEIRRWGQVDLSSYFGEYPPPIEAPAGKVEKQIQICNGIFFAWASEQWLLSICEPIWESELSIPANFFGTQKGDYMFFDLTTAAILIFELAPYHPEVCGLIASEEALYRLLQKCFSTYLTASNLDKEQRFFSTQSKTYEQLAQEYLAFPAQ